MNVNVRWFFCASWMAIAVLLGTVSARRAELFNDPVQLLQSAYQQQPDSITIHTALAAYLAKAGDVHSAAEHTRRADELLQQSVASRPDAVNLNHYGIRLRRRGQPADAIVFLTRARALAPHSGPILNNLGMALVECGRPGEAVARFQEAVALVPHDPDVWAGLAFAQARAGEPEQAQATAEHAIEIATQQENSALVAGVRAWLKSLVKGDR